LSLFKIRLELARDRDDDMRTFRVVTLQALE